MRSTISTEDPFHQFVDIPHCGDLDMLGFGNSSCPVWDDDMFKAELFRLGHTLLGLGHRSDLARKSDLSAETITIVDRNILTTAQDGHHDGHIHRGLLDPDTSRQIQEYIPLSQPEATTFLKYGQ